MKEQSRRWELQPGALLVLYTDGLTESKHDCAEGERRLHDALQLEELPYAEHPARTIFDAVLFDGVRDDAAILTLRLPEGATYVSDAHWTFASTDRESAGGVRRAIGALLLERGASDNEVFCTDMVFSELISNVYRYAPGPVDVRLDWRGDTMVLHVIDDGASFCPNYRTIQCLNAGAVCSSSMRSSKIFTSPPGRPAEAMPVRCCERLSGSDSARRRWSLLNHEVRMTR